MDTQRREKIELGLLEIRERVPDNLAKERERVRIAVDALLKGQEAVNYEVAKLFAEDLTHQAFIQLIFRIGLKNVIQLVRAVADENGITL